MRALLPLLLLPIATLSAQNNNSQTQRPSVSTTGRSELKVAPDRATLRISVQTRATTASEAASQNATKQTAVLDALRRLGFTNEQLSTSDFNVNPEYRYDQGQAPKIINYVVTNTVVVDIQDISKVGKVIDAAIANGTNMISSLNFYASNTDAARQQAIKEAVARARAEADAAARGVGATLGAPIDIEVSADYAAPSPQPFLARTMAMKADATPINPEQQTVMVTVSTRWELLLPTR